MWLPTPIYERLPLFWFLIGLLFLGYGFYEGLNLSIAEVTVIAGVVCCFYGGGLRVVRIQHRRKGSSDDNAQEFAS